jgi:uncharacterized protein
MVQLLSLFPLSTTVLFPGSSISIHVHEERYKLMIGRCLALREPLGIVLIREGPEVGGTAVPYEVGTMATITNTHRYNDGQMVITVEGTRRFRIQHMVQQTPYLIASVELLDDSVDLDRQQQAQQLCEIYEQYRNTVSYATGVPQALPDLPDQPVELSYQLSTRLQVPFFSKQQLLEADLETRLEALTAALADELRLLPQPSDRPIEPGNSWSLN